jgi:hypothetical protein
MVCADLRASILRGEPPPAEVRAHAAECPACAELLADEAALGRRLASVPESAEPALGALLAELHRAIERDSGPTAWLRSRTTPFRVAVALAAVALVSAYQLVFARRVDLPVYPAGTLLVSVAAHVLALGLTVAIALRPLQKPAPAAWVGPVAIAAAVLVPVALALRAPVHENHPVSLIGAGSDFAPLALGCFLYGGMLAVPVLGLLWALDRGEHRSKRAALLAAAFGGLAANLALELHCPSTQLTHLLAGHATIAVVAVMVYAVFGRAFFSRR